MNDLLSLAAQNLPNLVSLLGMFIQEHRHRDGLNHQDLIEWLDNHRFQELKAIITETHGIEREIDTLLKDQQSNVLAELQIVSRTVSQIASGMEVLGSLATKLSPKIQLSDQAIWMLMKLEEESRYPIMSIMRSGKGTNMIQIGTASYETVGSRYMREDLRDLAACGLIIKQGHNSDGEPQWAITRLGSDFVERLPTDAIQEAPPENPA